MIRKALNWTRKSRKRKIGAAMAVLSLVGAGSALAYFLVEGQGSGSETLPVSTPATQSLTVSFANTPGQQILPCGTDMASTFGSSCSGDSQEVNVQVTDPANGNAAKVSTVTPSIDPSSLPAGCQAAWFLVHIEPSGLPVTVQPGSGAQTIYVVQIGLTDLSSTDQSMCEGANVKLNVAVA